MIKGYAFKPVPAAITAIMFAVLVGLGIWQVERAAWKRGIIDQYNAQSKLEALVALPPAEEATASQYRHATLGGKFQTIHEIRLRPRALEGKQGYELITPFKLYTGEVILVDRGFVPDETRDAINQPIGTVAVSGVLRPFSPQGWRPDNKPKTNEWYWLDYNAVADFIGDKNLYPLLLAGNDKPVGTPWPAPQPFDAGISNNHLGYAATWFLLAIILLLIFLKASRVKP